MRRNSRAKNLGLLAVLLAAPLSLPFSGTAALAQAAAPEPGLPATAPPPVPPLAPTVPNLHQEEGGRPLVRGESVFDRPRPEYDPIGVRVGGFFLYPRAELEETYNDNIFATKKGTDDFITVVRPEAALLSNWGQHELNFRVGASIGTFASHSSENFADYLISTDGRYDIDHNLSAFGALKFEHLHEDRDDPNSAGVALHPVEYDAYTGTVGLAQKGLRIGYEASFVIHREDYENGTAIGGGALDLQVRNLTSFTPSVRLNYEIVPNYEAFVRATGIFVAYDNSTAGNSALNPSRDSNGYRFDAGGRIDLTGVTYAELYAGYLSQEYSDTRLGAISGVDAGARVVWNPDSITSVIFNGDRRVVDANNFAAGGVANSAGYLRSGLSAEVDHELLRNVLLNASVIFENDDYQGIDRSDNRIDLTAGARYLLNNNIYLGAAYTYTNRDSTGAQAFGQFSRNLFMIRLTGQM